MIFNTLIKGGITGKPIEVTELPTPAEKDVGKIYLLKREEKEFIYPEVGQAIGDKIYFDTSVNPLDYVDNLGNIVVAVNGEDYYSLALVDILAMQNIEGYGHAYVLGMTDSTMSVILGLPYIYCDTLTVEQFNSMVGAQFGVSIPSFGWLTDVIDTSTIADWTIDENNVSSYGNIAYTDFEIKQSEEYYKVDKVEGTPIEVGKPVPNILHYNMSVTPDFSNVPADGSGGVIYFATNEQYILGMAGIIPEEGTENQGTIQMVALQLMNQFPIILYVDGTASIETINGMFGTMGINITQKGWQGNGTVNITDEAIKIGTAVGAPMEQIESMLAAGFADPVTSFNDPQGIFIVEDQYVFETLGGSGFPIEVEELPTNLTEDDLGKVYHNTTTDEYYEVVNIAPITVGTRLGATIKCDTSKTPAQQEGTLRFLVSTDIQSPPAMAVVDYGGYGLFAMYLDSDSNQTLQAIYVPVGVSIEEYNEVMSSAFGDKWSPVTEDGWQTDTIATGIAAGCAVTEANDTQGLFFKNGISTVICNNKAISNAESEKAAAEQKFVNLIEGNSFNLDIPDGVTEIRAFAFYYGRLSSVNIPDSVTRIGGSAFANCNGLTNVTVGNGVISLDDRQFYGCYSLKSITIGRGVEDIWRPYEVLGGCRLLSNIVVDPDNAYYMSLNGDLYTKDGKTILRYAIGKVEPTYNVPAGITTIGVGAYSGQNNSDRGGIVDLSISQDVETVGAMAFEHNDNLKTVWIGGRVKTLEGSAFSSCTYLEKVDIVASLTKIENQAFSHCTALKTFTILQSTPPECDSQIFIYCTQDLLSIYVSLPSIDAYKTADGWSTYASQMYPYIETEAELSSIDTSLYTKANVGGVVYNYADGAWTAEQE